MRCYHAIYEELPYATTIEFANRGSDIYYAKPEGFDLNTTEPKAVDKPQDSSAARARGAPAGRNVGRA